MAPSVICCPLELDAIDDAIRRAQQPEARETAREHRATLGARDTAAMILDRILNAPDELLGMKQFHDLAADCL
jgi:hypothetical protein